MLQFMLLQMSRKWYDLGGMFTNKMVNVDSTFQLQWAANIYNIASCGVWGVECFEKEQLSHPWIVGILSCCRNMTIETSPAMTITDIRETFAASKLGDLDFRKMTINWVRRCKLWAN